ncbi:MAG TPA: Gfo/Idh/MocA family oxidoreductase [bacterium]|nr:Gfo/Idh/MocA family oxidoreductase [bacterium]
MKKVKMGVMGAGGIAYRKTIPGMLKARNIELAAVMDVANIEKIAGEFNIPRYYSNEKDLLNDPEVKAVYIATPVHLHLKHIKSAAEKGKHILCEKPVAKTLKEAKEAISACRSNNVFFQEGYMMKFHGAHKKIRELVKKGNIGRVVYMRAQLSCWYPPVKGAWRQDPSKGGGGSLIDMATHLYDLLEFFTGEKITHVAALTGRLVQNYKSEDSSTTLLQFSSGAQATVDAFFCIPDEASRTRLEIYGSQGSILAEGTIGQGTGGALEGIFKKKMVGYDSVQNKDVATKFGRIDFEKVNPYTAECEYFADCVIKRRPPEINNGDNALHIMDITGKAYASFRSKKILKV